MVITLYIRLVLSSIRNHFSDQSYLYTRHCIKKIYNHKIVKLYKSCKSFYSLLSNDRWGFELQPASVGSNFDDLTDEEPEWLRWVMFAAEDEGRTEEATEQKKSKEREKGRFPKSQEIPSGLVTLGGFSVLFFFAGWILRGLARIMKLYLGDFTSLPAVSIDMLVPLLIKLLWEVAWIMAPLLIVVMIMAFLGNVLQVGFFFSLKPLAFDFSRIKFSLQNVMKKVLFSKQVAMNLLKTIIKIAIMGFISYTIISSDFLTLMKSGSVSMGDTLQTLGFLAFKLSITLTVVLLLMAIPDYFYQRYEFSESIKMTKEEVKQEFKEQEGDPHVKARQRQRASENLRRNMMGKVQEADVIITNPTHYAIAVKYDPSQYTNPYVLAKGEDHLALIIRNLAKKNDIPMVENKPLARELYATVNEGDQIPEEFFEVLIEIFMSIDSLKNKFMARAS